jgi:hypothetical protein
LTPWESVDARCRAPRAAGPARRAAVRFNCLGTMRGLEDRSARRNGRGG